MPEATDTKKRKRQPEEPLEILASGSVGKAQPTSDTFILGANSQFCETCTRILNDRHGQRTDNFAGLSATANTCVLCQLFLRKSKGSWHNQSLKRSWSIKDCSHDYDCATVTFEGTGCKTWSLELFDASSQSIASFHTLMLIL